MSNQSILLVEDDRDLVESLANFIESKGHAVDIAFTGEEGFTAANNKDYDAILLDIGLPDFNGVSVLYKIKKVKPFSRILLITGFSNHHVEREFTPGEPLPFMTKPLDLNAMMEWLTRPVRPFKLIHNSS